MFCKALTNLVLMTLVAGSPLVAQTPAEHTTFEQAAIDMLRCDSAPAPLPLFEALEAAGLIHADEMIGFDSVSCFRIDGGIEIAGASFVSICGYEEDGRIQALRPDLLWRGPGTSPGQFVSFGSDMDENALSAWYLRTFGPARLDRAVASGSTMLGDNSEVYCSAWMLH